MMSLPPLDPPRFYQAWKQHANVAENPTDARYRGAFSQILRLLLQRRLVFIDKRQPGIVAWAVDKKLHGGRAKALQIASERVTAIRKAVEDDKCGITMGVCDFPSVVPPGIPLRTQLDIHNTRLPAVQGPPYVELISLSWLGHTTLSWLEISTPEPLPFKILPGQRLPLNLDATPPPGMTRNVLCAKFRSPDSDFTIGRYVSLEAGDPTIHNLLKAKSPYKRKRVRRRTAATKTEPAGDVPPGSAQPW